MEDKDADAIPLRELFESAPDVLEEMTKEYFRRADECLLADDHSQLSACYLLALRSVSIITSMSVLLQPTAIDGFDVLARALLETRDLLMTFRFDDEGARQRIHYWFEGKRDNSWKADHQKCERLLTKWGAQNVVLGEPWSMVTVLSHPTCYAADHSFATLTALMDGRARSQSVSNFMMTKRADFLIYIARLCFATTFDFAEWVSLGLDMNRMPRVEPFRERVERIAVPFLNRATGRIVPPQSYTPVTGKSAKNQT